MGGAIFTSSLSLFHFFRNSQHPENWIVLRILLRISSGNMNTYLFLADNLEFNKKVF